MTRLEKKEQIDLLELQSVSYIQGAKFHNNQRENLDVSTLKYLADTAAMLTSLGTGLELKLKFLLVKTRADNSYPRIHKLLALFNELDVEIQKMLQGSFENVHDEVGVKLEVITPQSIASEKPNWQSEPMSQSSIVIPTELARFLVEKPHGSREFHQRAPIVEIDELWTILDNIASADNNGVPIGVDRMRYRYETYSKHDIWINLTISIDQLIRVFDEIAVNDHG